MMPMHYLQSDYTSSKEATAGERGAFQATGGPWWETEFWPR